MSTNANASAKRKRPLVHLSLSTEAIARLTEIALRRGETRSGMVERLIREAEMPRTRPMAEGRAAVDRLLATGRARA